MITEKDMAALEAELISLRDAVAARELSAQQAWEFLDRLSTMADDAGDGPFRERIDFIYTMVSAVWSNLRNIEALRRIIR